MITSKCKCGANVYESGYCCNSRYQENPCSSVCTDSDGDTLCDDDELNRGTNPNSDDTDGDGLTDANDPYPLCNDNGKCETGGNYPENAENCPADCAEEEFPWLWLLAIIILIILALLFGFACYYFFVLGDPSHILDKPFFKKRPWLRNLLMKKKKPSQFQPRQPIIEQEPIKIEPVKFEKPVLLRQTKRGFKPIPQIIKRESPIFKETIFGTRKGKRKRLK